MNIMGNLKRIMNDINLPAVIPKTTSVLKALTDALSVPRNVVASDEEILAAWENLPRVMQKIPPGLRDKGIARMCIAVTYGLFDSAINYIWNASEVELRGKVKRFGLNVVGQVIGKENFGEAELNDMRTAELLTLCLKLNLITEDGFFFLDQCRDIRNNFSAAHPNMGDIDDNEFISFFNRCAKYALGNEQNPVGVDIYSFVKALKHEKFTQDQNTEWVKRLNNTHQAQRDLLFGTLHGVYCDPSSSEEARINALTLMGGYKECLSSSVRSELIDRHQDYIASGDESRRKASQQFFEKLGLLDLLGDTERHSLISNTCKKLLSIHQAFDNFYNEPPFAERVYQLSSQSAVPDTARDEFVNCVVTCAVGNQYGISNAAYAHYQNIVKNFSPAEIALMLFLSTNKNTLVGRRIKAIRRCHESFKSLVTLIDPSSVSTSVQSIYNRWRT